MDALLEVISTGILFNTLINTTTLTPSITYLNTWDFLGQLLVQNILSNHRKFKTILKKFQIETILKIPGHIGLESVDVWFQDEA